MNHLFRPYFRKYVLIFFDDILVYNKTVEDHQRHVREVLKILKENHLFAKRSKYKFGCIRVDYLGHVITEMVSPLTPESFEQSENCLF